MREQTIKSLQEVAGLRVRIGDAPPVRFVQISRDEAREVLDMLSDLRYASEAVARAYRREPADPRQLSLVSRYADIDRCMHGHAMGMCPECP